MINQSLLQDWGGKATELSHQTKSKDEKIFKLHILTWPYIIHFLVFI